jgi:hypothetical protein
MPGITRVKTAIGTKKDKKSEIKSENVTNVLTPKAPKGIDGKKWPITAPSTIAERIFAIILFGFPNVEEFLGVV